jgi:hypothetical protein
MSGEYNNQMAGGPIGSYQTLCSYNANSAMAPVSSKTSVGVQIVPSFGSISTSTLTHGGRATGQAYFSIENAYGAGASQCNTQYVARQCAGGCNQ